MTRSNKATTENESEKLNTNECGMPVGENFATLSARQNDFSLLALGIFTVFDICAVFTLLRLAHGTLDVPATRHVTIRESMNANKIFTYLLIMVAKILYHKHITLNGAHFFIFINGIS